MLLCISQVYEDAAVAVGLSIDIWIAYIDFTIKNDKPEQETREWVFYDSHVEESIAIKLYVDARMFLRSHDGQNY